VDAVDLATKLGLLVAVRGGGHNVAGRAISNASRSARHPWGSCALNISMAR
jgi:hypothetical protein